MPSSASTYDPMDIDSDSPSTTHVIPQPNSSFASSSTQPPLSINTQSPSQPIQTNSPKPSHLDLSSQAGPSQLPYFPIPYASGIPHLRTRLHPTQDLVSRTGFLPAYNELVRPYTRIPPQTTVTADGTSSAAGLGEDKGKGKEVDEVMRTEDRRNSIDPSSVLTNGFGSGAPGQQGQPPDTKKKKHEHGWKFLVSSKVSGRVVVKKDTYLQDVLKAPPKRKVELVPFDRSTLEGFRLEEGQMDQATMQQLGLGPEEEKKKKKKKNKKLDAAMPTGDSTIQPSFSDQQQQQNVRRSSTSGVPTPSPFPQQPRTPAGGPRPSPLPQVSTPQQWQQQPRTPIAVNGQISNGVGGGGGGGGLNGVYGGATGKVDRVRKEREGETGVAVGVGQPLLSQNQNAAPGQQQPRPHKKRKVEGHGPSHHHPPQPQPMQQATPTF